jgi:cyclic pyranopterin phosphate synthase
MTELSHVDESSGDVTMVDVGHKPLSRRKAIARGTVLMAPETARRIRDLPKGDALATAQVAGILAAKRTSDLIPLCHPGVEMEALTAVAVAALTIYDMAKAIDKGMVISEITLIEKTKVEV